MAKLNEYNLGNKFTGCFIGTSGAGKSIAATSFAKYGKLKWLVADNRVRSVVEWWKKHDPTILDNIDFDAYLPAEYDKIASKLEDLQLNCPYKFVLLDPLTMFGHQAILYSMGFRNKDARTGKESGTAKGKLKIPDPDDYKAENHAIKRMIEAGHAIKAHFILTAHILETQYYELGDDKPRVSRSILTAGLKPAAFVPTMFDEVWLFTSRPAAVIGQPEEHLVYTRPSTEFKDLHTSSSTIPLEINWTNKNFFNLVRKHIGLGEEVSPVTAAVQ